MILLKIKGLIEKLNPLLRKGTLAELIIIFREVLEASLIIGILYTYLKKSNNEDNIKIKEIVNFLRKKNIIKYSIQTYDIGIGNALLCYIFISNDSRWF